MIENEKEYMQARREALRLAWSIIQINEGKCITIQENHRHDTLNRQMAAYDARFYGDRKGAWFPVFSGKRFWPEDPRPDDIDIKDIAHSLARLARFNGQTKGYWSYSVAQHSVLVASILPREYKLFGLFHDAAEAYLGDLITPVKNLFRQYYEGIEDAVMRAVAARFGFIMTDEAKRQVKRADTALLMTEIRDLTPSGVYNGHVTELPLEEKIGMCLMPEDAEEDFLETYKVLCGQAA